MSLTRAHAPRNARYPPWLRRVAHIGVRGVDQAGARRSCAVAESTSCSAGVRSHSSVTASAVKWMTSSGVAGTPVAVRTFWLTTATNGRASLRGRVGSYVVLLVVDGYFKKK